MVRPLPFALALFVGVGVAAASLAATGWVNLPTAADMVAVYPPRALSEQREGRAVVECGVGADGALSACRAVSEAPSDYGFGSAALALVPKMRRVAGAEGGRTIAVPFLFVPPPPSREPIFRKGSDRFRDFGAVGPYYPVRAAEAGVGGAALIQCNLAATGVLTKCSVLSESPSDVGFGPAARRMAESRWMTAQPRIVDGAPVADEVVQLLVPFGSDRR